MWIVLLGCSQCMELLFGSAAWQPLATRDDPYHWLQNMWLFLSTTLLGLVYRSAHAIGLPSQVVPVIAISLFLFDGMPSLSSSGTLLASLPSALAYIVKQQRSLAVVTPLYMLGRLSSKKLQTLKGTSVVLLCWILLELARGIEWLGTGFSERALVILRPFSIVLVLMAIVPSTTNAISVSGRSPFFMMFFHSFLVRLPGCRLAASCSTWLAHNGFGYLAPFFSLLVILASLGVAFSLVGGVYVAQLASTVLTLRTPGSFHHFLRGTKTLKALAVVLGLALLFYEPPTPDEVQAFNSIQGLPPASRAGWS